MNDIFKSDEEVDELLGHKNNVLVVKHKVIGSGNHGNHDKGDKRAGSQVRGPEEQAKIGTLAKLVGNKAASVMTGVGPTQVSQHKNGKNSNGDVKVEIVKDEEAALDALGNKAIDKVDILLELMTEDLVQDMKAKEIPAAAEKLINVADKIKRRNQVRVDEASASKPQIHFYAPVQLKVDQYVTKEVE